MNISYNINSKDLDSSIIESIKAFFKDKELTITIREKVDQTSIFTTDAKTKHKIIRGITESKTGKGIKFDSVKDFESFVKNNTNPR